MKKIFVNGSFDLLHCAHVDLLNYAKSRGNYLLVAIDTDQRIRELKGPNRPIYNQNDRKNIIESLRAVDEAVLFNDNKYLQILGYTTNYESNINSQVNSSKENEFLFQKLFSSLTCVYT